MYNGARTFALPPQTIRLPLKEPLSLLRGATPTRAAICPRLKLPSSGRWAISVEQSTRPTPGTLRRRSSRARHMGVERISSSRSLLKPSTLESSQPMCSLIWEWSLLGAVRNRLRSLVSISHELATTVHQTTQLPRLCIGQRSAWWPDCLCEASEDQRIYAISLGQFAHSPSKVSNLPRVDYRYR